MKKVKKFAVGGLNGLFTPNALTIAPNYPTGVTPANPMGGGGAYGGLKNIDQGAGQVRSSLQNIKNELGETGGGLTYGSGPLDGGNYKKGGSVKKSKSASKRADGCAIRGKTRA
jgi:hypothetical protein